MVDPSLDERIAAVRRFNRFYTQRIGVLHEGWVNSPFSLAEARVLYELAHRDNPTATELANDLGLDTGYLSRILRTFETRGYIVKRVSDNDGRQSLISMTQRGRRAFSPVETHTNDEIGAVLTGLTTEAQTRLFAAMTTIENLLGGAEPKEPYVLRPPRAGDMGWIVARHGTLYAQEYGWNEHLEALTAEIVAAFVRHSDPTRERCWIAERDRENVGCVMLVKETPEVARLRLLLVVPAARGLGIGARLVDECVQFARNVGYRKITLWTHSVLTAARHIYRTTGFKLTSSETHDSFGQPIVGETWDLEL